MRTLISAGILAYRLGRYEESLDFTELAVEVARELGEKGGLSRALAWLAHCREALDRNFDAWSLYDESISLGRDSGDVLILARALIGAGEHRRLNGDLGGAWSLYEEALEAARREANPIMICTILENQVRVLVPKGELDHVPKMILECVHIINDTGIKSWATGLFDGMAGLASAHEDWETAARFLGMAEGMNEAIEYHREPADEQFARAVFDQTRAALEPGVYRAAFDAGKLVSVDEGLAELEKRLS